MPNNDNHYLGQAIRYTAGSMGHELNNLLTIILGNSGILRRQCPNLAQNIDSIDKAVEDIIKKTKQVTVIAGRMGGARRPIKLAETLDSAYRAIIPDLANANMIQRIGSVPNDTVVRLDPSSLPMSIYYCLQALTLHPTSKIECREFVEAESSSEIRLEFTGAADLITDEILARASSSHDDILIGEDPLSIGLSAAKAFAHRSQGKFKVHLKDQGLATISMTLPTCQTPKSFK